MLVPLVLYSAVVNAQPADATRDQITFRGTVEAVDQTVQTATVGEDQGSVVAPGIAQPKAPFDRFRLAEIVVATVPDHVTRTKAMSLSVGAREAGQSQPTGEAAETLRERLTMSVLWGLDNQFSGKMIESATGQTTTGVPINLTETSYDDVYGRMGFFKIGAGYRLNPRSEAVANFVYSNSGSELVDVGTAGAATPLYVDFDDFSYWGLEGGQRFFFTRVRFTPYVGYLVGINRYGNIRGTFVDVPLNVTPGLAAQDGKFFEKSWALSLGPTGGFLIGLGPIEFMFETQLRYMGGLSDVDWLVEEGLRDINSESSRWSLPVQIGARIRF
jgi:hypothetical protein